MFFESALFLGIIILWSLRWLKHKTPVSIRRFLESGWPNKLEYAYVSFPLYECMSSEFPV